MNADLSLVASVESGSKLHLSWVPEEDLLLQVLKIYFEKQVKNPVYVIRIFERLGAELNGPATHPFFEFPFSYNKGNWSVKGMTPNKSYYAEIGVKLSENHYFPLLRSNSVFIPKTSKLDEEKELISYRHQNHLTNPKWFEHVSTYSYYQNSSSEGADE